MGSPSGYETAVRGRCSQGDPSVSDWELIDSSGSLYNERRKDDGPAEVGELRSTERPSKGGPNLGGEGHLGEERRFRSTNRQYALICHLGQPKNQRGNPLVTDVGAVSSPVG